MTTPAERWIVRCDDYTKPTTYKTEADARRAIEALEELGHCKLPHEAVRQP